MVSEVSGNDLEKGRKKRKIGESLDFVWIIGGLIM
jgi:hypothetical protein